LALSVSFFSIWQMRSSPTGWSLQTCSERLRRG
jgi:hypothetical protein